MKILTISNYYPSHPGGIEFVALNLVKHWRARHQVRWMACDVKNYPHPPDTDDVPLPALNFAEERLGFPYPVPTGKWFSRVMEQVKWCDVLHIHDSLYLVNIAAFLASRWYGKPLLVTQHVALVPYPHHYKNVLQKLAYHTLGRLVLEKAEKVVFISARVKNWFEARMRFRHEPTVIRNGVDTTLFHPATVEEREKAREQMGFSPGEIVCLFVGRFTQKKGLHLVQEIARSRPQYKWLLIGRDELDPRVWGLDNVTVIAPMAQAALRQYYIAADLFVLPSIGEGFPLAVQEALSSGLPAAVSRELADDVPNSPLIEVDVSSLSAVLQTLDDLFACDQRLLELRNASAEYAKRWNWANVAYQYDSLLTDLVRHPG
jgi:starch synthase